MSISVVSFLIRGIRVFHLINTFVKAGLVAGLLMGSSLALAYSSADPNLYGGFLPGNTSFDGGVSEQNGANIGMLDVIRAFLPTGGVAVNTSTSTVLPDDKTARLSDPTIRVQTGDDPSDDIAQ